MTSDNNNFDVGDVDGLEKVSLGKHCPNCGEELFKIIAYGGLPIPYECSCKKAAREAEEKQQQIKEERNKRRKEIERIKRLHELSDFPPKQQKQFIDNFELLKGTETAFNATQRFIGKVPDVRKGILFIGACGSGKTHLAAAIGNAVLDKGYSVKFITADKLYKNVRSTYTSFDMTENDILSPLEKCYLLIIDDVGTTAPTKWAKSVLHSLIDSRMNSEKPTILTTNLTMKELAEELDSRTIDRIPEGFVTFTITAPSYRKKKG